MMPTPNYRTEPRELTGFGRNGKYLGYARQRGSELWDVYRNGAIFIDEVDGPNKARALLRTLGADHIEDSWGDKATAEPVTSPDTEEAA